MADNILRYTAYVDLPTFSAMPFDVGQWMDTFIPSMMAVSIKQLYGWVVYAAFFFALGFLLWDIPSVRRRTRKFPSWVVVGVRMMARQGRRSVVQFPRSKN